MSEPDKTVFSKTLLGLSSVIAVAALTFVIGTIFLTETRHVRIWKEVRGDTPDDERRLNASR